jgi:hypothetical protein
LSDTAIPTIAECIFLLAAIESSLRVLSEHRRDSLPTGGRGETACLASARSKQYTGQVISTKRRSFLPA